MGYDRQAGREGRQADLPLMLHMLQLPWAPQLSCSPRPLKKLVARPPCRNRMDLRDYVPISMLQQCHWWHQRVLYIKPRTSRIVKSQWFMKLRLKIHIKPLASMLFQLIWTHWSLSGLVCSWKNPMLCSISWTTTYSVNWNNAHAS